MVKQVTDKVALGNWKRHVAMLSELNSVDPNEPYADKLARIAKLEADAESWFGYYFPRFAFAVPAQFHKEATKRLLKSLLSSGLSAVNNGPRFHFGLLIGTLCTRPPFSRKLSPGMVSRFWI